MDSAMRNPESLKVFREKKNITRAQLAEQLGVSERYIIMLEKKERTPSFKIASKLSDILDIPKDSIFLIFN